MEKRIELERRGKKPEDIKDLNLDNCRSTTIVGLSDEYCNLEHLSLINVGLTSLKGFPKLPNLKKLELSDNRINNGLNYLCTSPKLQSLNLSGNKIKELDVLEPLKEFSHLRTLDLFNNEATTSIENYRDKIFKMIPSLKFLDGYDAEDCEAAPSDMESEDEVNGNEDDDDDDEDDEDERDSSDNDVGLGAVYQENLDDLSDEDDYEAVDEEEEEEDAIEEEEEEDADSPSKAHIRGKKRKHEDGESAENNSENN